MNRIETEKKRNADNETALQMWELQVGLRNPERVLLQRLLTDAPDSLDASLLRQLAHERAMKSVFPLPHEIFNLKSLAAHFRVHPSLGSPFALHAQGHLPLPKRSLKRTVALIGSRHPTASGRMRARELTSQLLQAGCYILSGGAIGIDTIALQTALDESSKRKNTISSQKPQQSLAGAVLGSGLHCPYPQSNWKLFQDPRLLKISEFPPHTPARPYHFPMRNFTLAWLADYILVVESKKQSGSLITAHEGAALGKEVGAVVWPEDHPLASGNNELIAGGAHAVCDAEDVLRELT